MNEIAVFAPVNGLLSLRSGLSPFTEQASNAGMVAPQDISVDLDETAQVDLPPLRPRRARCGSVPSPSMGAVAVGLLVRRQAVSADIRKRAQSVVPLPESIRSCW